MFLMVPGFEPCQRGNHIGFGFRRRIATGEYRLSDGGEMFVDGLSRLAVIRPTEFSAQNAKRPRIS